MDKRINNGGKRKGAGRPKVSYKTTTIAFRVKLEHVEPVKEYVKILIQNLNKQSCKTISDITTKNVSKKK